MKFPENSCSVEYTLETIEDWTDLPLCNTNKYIKESVSKKKKKSEMHETFSTGEDVLCITSSLLLL